MPDTLVLAFVTKAPQTARGIVVLYERDLHHEAQSLVRILFEVSINCQYFLQMFGENPRGACERVIDAVMLEKLKQQKSSDYAGLGLLSDGPTIGDFERVESEISHRYSKESLRLLRRHGFSGLTVEERAARVGRGDLYQIVYRNFSRNVHGGDFMELVLANEPHLIGRERYDAYIQSRDTVAVQLAFGSLGAVLLGANGLFHLGFDQRFEELTVRRERVREAHREEES